MTVNNADFMKDEKKKIIDDAVILMKSGNIPKAIDILGQLAKDLTDKFEGNSLHPSLGDVWYYYGISLLESYTLDGGKLFGETNSNEKEEESLEEDTKHEESTEEGEVDVDEEGEDPMGEEEGENDELLDDDLEAAWEALETARVIFLSDHSVEGKLKLAECHIALGDLFLEQEKFDESIEEFNNALLLKQQHASGKLREISEIEFKISCAYDFSGNKEKAIEGLRKVLDSVKLLQERLKCGPQNSSDIKGKGKMGVIGFDNISEADAIKELEELKDLTLEIEDRMKELQPNMMVAQLNDMKSLDSQNNMSSSAPVNSLGTSLIKRKNNSTIESENKRSCP